MHQSLYMYYERKYSFVCILCLFLILSFKIFIFLNVKIIIFVSEINLARIDFDIEGLSLKQSKLYSTLRKDVA